MSTQRLDGPFAATRRYGVGPLAVGFDILTLPFQISNTLFGVPPLEIPNFDGAAPDPTPTPGSEGGLQGSFGVEGLSLLRSDLGYQTITVGSQTFSSVRVRWNGLVRNTGNVPLSGATIRLRTLLSPGTVPIREISIALPTIQPGSTAPASPFVDLLSSDPPGAFLGVIVVEQASLILGQVASPVLGTINPSTGILIEGTFGI